MPVLGSGGAGGDTSTTGMKAAVVVVAMGSGATVVVVSGGAGLVVVVCGGTVGVASGGNVVDVDVVVVCGSVVDVEVVVGTGDVVVVVDVVGGGDVVVLVVVVSGSNVVVVVVVGGTGTSIVAVAEMIRGVPAVTKLCAPCGSGPAGLPAVDERRSGTRCRLQRLSSTPGATDIVARADSRCVGLHRCRRVLAADQQGHARTENRLRSSEHTHRRSGRRHRPWPRSSRFAGKRCSLGIERDRQAWMSSRPLASATMSSDGTSGALLRSQRPSGPSGVLGVVVEHRPHRRRRQVVGGVAVSPREVGALRSRRVVGELLRQRSPTARRWSGGCRG